MRKYNFIIYTLAGGRIFFKDLNTEQYDLLRQWLDGNLPKIPYPFMFNYANTTYYFPPASRFVAYYEVFNEKVKA